MFGVFGLWFLVVSGCVFVAVQLVFGLVGGAVVECQVESCLVAGSVSIHEVKKVDGFSRMRYTMRRRRSFFNVALNDLRPGVVPAHSRAADEGEDLVVLQTGCELPGGVLAAPAACGRS